MSVSMIEAGIDMIQLTKKQIVRATVSDQRVADGLNTFVDQQTALSKTIVKNYFEFTKIALDNVFPNVNKEKL